MSEINERKAKTGSELIVYTRTAIKWGDIVVAVAAPRRHQQQQHADPYHVTVGAAVAAAFGEQQIFAAANVKDEIVHKLSMY